jgi:hypothetical protein
VLRHFERTSCTEGRASNVIKNVVFSAKQKELAKQDLVDTFDLFKTYLDHKLHDLKSDIISEQENLSLKVKEQVNLKFKSEGNKIQFRFNEEIAADLAKLQKHCTSSVNNSLVTDICDKLKSRNKLIRIADTSAGGWATVREYEQNEIADNQIMQFMVKICLKQVKSIY